MAAHYAAYREQGINEWTGEGFRNCLRIEDWGVTTQPCEEIGGRVLLLGANGGTGLRNCLKTILMPKIVALWLPGTKVPVYSQSPRWGSNRGVPEELVIVARQFIAGKRGHSCYDFVRFQDFETLSSSLSLRDDGQPRVPRGASPLRRSSSVITFEDHFNRAIACYHGYRQAQHQICVPLVFL